MRARRSSLPVHTYWDVWGAREKALTASVCDLSVSSGVPGMRTSSRIKAAERDANVAIMRGSCRLQPTRNSGLFSLVSEKRTEDAC